jgi:hypothetical protein
LSVTFCFLAPQLDPTQGEFARLERWQIFKKKLKAICVFLNPIFHDTWHINFSIPQIPKVKKKKLIGV